MKPGIAKEPKDVPHFTDEQIKWLTDVIFMNEENPADCDAVFVFGGTHPGHWEKAIKAYHLGYGKKFVVTGGISPTGVKHEQWSYGDQAESVVIKRKMMEAGIPETAIVNEDTSRNSFENVTHSLMVFDFTQIKKLLVVCKAHVAGRQIRTLQKHLPYGIKIIPFGFPARYKGIELNSDSWHLTLDGRARVWGEYLRICTYGDSGHLQGISADERMI